ncbi:EAL domain-containing protein [Moritella sp. 5]|uniref:EAL domain-containing protein n=1 Tax=Moritella sp. 5 TaxID=2746231 RepID=UPI001BAD30CE|nr:EAL domain-containing protein [Moritella sp. 5]QUM79608.1 EAL domain-containing protein [Moritella sp. 5]
MKIYFCDVKEAYCLIFHNYIIRSAFQAIVDVDGNIIGYEALARICLRDSGLVIRPDVFFSILKNNDESQDLLFLINRLHLCSYRSSKFFKKYHKIFLNLTPDFFERLSDFPRIIVDVNKMLKEFDIPLTNVVAEVTESSAVCEGKLARGVKLISEYGYILALDDYGDEASDFERYKMCHPEIVKISRDFFLSHKASGSYINFKALIDAFKGYGSKVLVEGVELQDDHKVLLSLGVDYFQGFFFHKPECVSPCALVKGTVFL